MKRKVTLELPKNEAELLLIALDLLPKEKRTIVFEKLRANVQNVVTLYSNVTRTEILKKQQANMLNVARAPKTPPKKN